MAAGPGCIDANRAIDFVDGSLPPEGIASVEDHLSECQPCRQLIAELARGPSLVEMTATMCVAMGGTLAPVGPDAADMPRGTMVGRYVVLEPLGRGGMGIVYRAYDPELMRSVALKVMRVRGGTDEGATNARARLLREARALAQLQHPNVIVVHDVGTIGNDVFVAMEFVAGQPLGAWLSEVKRSIDEIADVFAAAGTGLEAAHDADLVHRDFKPDNVIVGDDGRVRVLDFGLVRGTGDVLVPDAAPDDTREASSPPSERSDDALTGDGFIIGTPAYMSPEQYTGADVDPRSDQFSFCVALYEALYGTRPFTGKTPRALGRAVVAGRLRPPPRSGDVPAHLRTLVLRGLSRRPEDRYPSMRAVLAALRPQRGRRVPNLAFAAVGALAIAGIAAVAVAMPRASERSDTVCKGARAAIEPTWGPDHRRVLVSAFEATGRSYAAATATAVADTFDVYAARWVDMHTQTCEATNVNGTQSAALLDLRMVCLDQRKVELGALVSALSAGPDGAIVDRAVQALSQLGALDACADVAALQRLVPLPSDPAARMRVIAIESDIAEATALFNTGNYPAGLELAATIEPRARALGHAPTHARALFALGQLQNKSADLASAETSLREATTVAARAKDDELTSRVWIELIWVVAYQNRFDDALKLRATAESALARAGDPPLLRAAMLHNLGSVMMVSGDYDGAQTSFEQAQRVREEVLGPMHQDVGASLQNLATLLRVRGDYPAAETAIKRALAAFIDSVGAEHPTVAGAMFVLGAIHHDQHHWDRALAAYQSSLELREAALGSADPLVAASSERVGVVLAAKGDYQGAIRRLQQAIEIKKAALGDDHPQVASALASLGDVLLMANDYEKALAIHTEALVIRTAKMGPTHNQVGLSCQRIGEALESLDRPGEAAEYFERALSIFATAANPLSIGAASFALARVIIRRDRARAIGLAKAARDAYVSLGDTGATDVEAIDAWLASN